MSRHNDNDLICISLLLKLWGSQWKLYIQRTKGRILYVERLREIVSDREQEENLLVSNEL